MIQRPRRYSNYTHPVMTLHLLNIPLRRRPRGASRKGPGGWAHVYVLWPIKITHFENRSRGPKRLHPPRDLFQHPCEWNGWNAVLYNLETLRRHLYLVHWKDEEAQCASSSCYCFGGGGGGGGFVERDSWADWPKIENHSAAAQLAPLECQYHSPPFSCAHLSSSGML